MTATYTPNHHSIPPTHGQAGHAPDAVTLPSRTSRKALWTGRILSGLVVLFMLFDATMKVLQLPVAVQGTTQLGYPESVVFGLGLVQLACLVLYLVPRTSVLGAVLWTGYLGGAIATHVRLGNPLFSHILFPVYVAAFFWAGLWLREERLRAILPFRATKS
ncbi:DoxX-like protein [Archangium gephyra]|uniref:Arginine/ornithine antiporter ArcD n=1 Tax=Archangium gephyra TaxID=48 RepID=A0AAC8Q7R0_9BACT|nr:DoxX family protein [Archangium gephyra]AKJ02033.1 Arginine/ornithine antiporter ArcD [Archangium gephyra]REG34836.1 DoxX-like protein [Archangium gephyra]